MRRRRSGTTTSVLGEMCKFCNDNCVSAQVGSQSGCEEGVLQYRDDVGGGAAADDDANRIDCCGVPCHCMCEHCGAGATRPSAGAPYCTPWSVGTSVQVTPSSPPPLCCCSACATVCPLCQHRPMRVIQASVCAWARSSCTPSPSSFSPLYPCNPSSRSVFTSFAFRSHTRAMPPIKTQKSH
jgi:hypothetical protein